MFKEITCLVCPFRTPAISRNGAPYQGYFSVIVHREGEAQALTLLQELGDSHHPKDAVLGLGLMEALLEFGQVSVQQVGWNHLC